MTITEPQVTVIIPTYNRSWGLRRAIASVLAQTYPHFALLIVDDASTDDTEAAVKSFEDSRIRYLRQTGNVGIGRNWGDGIRTVTTPFVCLLMDDDYYDPSFLENRVRLLEECPDALLVFSGYRRVDSDGGNQGQIRPICQDRQTYDGLNLLRIFLLEGGVFVGAMLYRREPVLRLWEGLERYDLVVDYALNLSLAMLPNARGVFCEALDFNMCIHKGQTFQTSNGCVYGLVEQVLRDQLTNIKAEYLTVLRCAYVNLLTAWALSEARNSRSSALRHLLRASAKSPQSVSLWRRWGYILLLILGVRD